LDVSASRLIVLWSSHVIAFGFFCITEP